MTMAKMNWWAGQNCSKRPKSKHNRELKNSFTRLRPTISREWWAHLLRGMGYFVAHDAPPGPDGGVDLIVYKDALGTVPPRIKVQVKHRRDTKVSVKEIRELHGLLNNDEVGLMISSGGFTSEAAREARSASK